MNTQQSHIEFAKRQLADGKPVPAVAGALMNRMDSDAEFNNLVQVTNVAQDELTGPANNTETESSESGTRSVDSQDQSPSSESTTSSRSPGRESRPAPDSEPMTDDEDDLDVDSIQDPDEQGASSWSA